MRAIPNLLWTALPPTVGLSGKPGQLQTDLAWSGGSLVIATRAAGERSSADPAGVSASPFGAPPAERSSLWRLPLDGAPPIWLSDPPPGSRVWTLHALGRDILVEHYPSGELRRPPVPPGWL